MLQQNRQEKEVDFVKQLKTEDEKLGKIPFEEQLFNGKLMYNWTNQDAKNKRAVTDFCKDKTKKQGTPHSTAYK